MATQHGERLFEIFTCDGLFSDDELREFEAIIRSGDDKTHRFTSSPFKNGKIVEPDISEMIWNRIKGHLPATYSSADGKTWKFVGVPHIVMYAEVKKGQLFGLHTDTGCVYEDDGKVRSKHTLLIYLNDDFAGGETEFFDSAWNRSCLIQPKANRLLCFDIDLFHQGKAVLHGHKRWLGTELVVQLVPIA